MSFSLLFYRTSTQNIQRKSDITELDVSKRCKDLASFMENLLQETRTSGLGKDALATDDRSFSVTISLVLVSPTLIHFASSTLWCAMVVRYMNTYSTVFIKVLLMTINLEGIS